MARQLWPGQDPIGQLIQFSDAREGRDVMEVVGVVPGIRDRVFDQQARAHIYVPFGQEYRSLVTFHIRTGPLDRRAETLLLKTLRERVRDIDPTIPVLAVQTFESFHQNSFWVWMVGMGGRLFAVFGGLALVLAVFGLYGVRAYDVARHTRQTGIRLALGATRKDILVMFLREGVILSCLGVGLGLPLALGAGRLIRSLLVGVSGADLATLTIVPALLTIAVLIACWIPARRAARTHPMEALRYEWDEEGQELRACCRQPRVTGGTSEYVPS